MYKENDDIEKIFFAKVSDKIKICTTKNKIVHTDFFNMIEKNKIVKNINYKNYFFFGGYKNAERELMIIYPEKLDINFVKKNLNSIVKVIRINLPNDLKGKYNHKDYLSGLMKLGIVREKIGDILVYNDGADIVVLNENAEYFKQNIGSLIRFKKSNIEVIDFQEIIHKEIEFEELSVVVNSMRIDNFVSEIARTSRKKANELLENGRVLVNYEYVYKPSKILKMGDILTIRGCGKFIISENIKETKNGRIVIKIKKYK